MPQWSGARVNIVAAGLRVDSVLWGALALAETVVSPVF
jgi:hypothetical protein